MPRETLPLALHTTHAAGQTAAVARSVAAKHTRAPMKTVSLHSSGTRRRRSQLHASCIEYAGRLNTEHKNGILLRPKNIDGQAAAAPLHPDSEATQSTQRTDIGIAGAAAAVSASTIDAPSACYGEHRAVVCSSPKASATQSGGWTTVHSFYWS